MLAHFQAIEHHRLNVLMLGNSPHGNWCALLIAPLPQANRDTLRAYGTLLCALSLLSPPCSLSSILSGAYWTYIVQPCCDTCMGLLSVFKDCHCVS